MTALALEQRTCATDGCGKTFRCLDTSSARHCSQFCAGASNGGSWREQPQKRRGRPKGSKNRRPAEALPPEEDEIGETEEVEEPEVDPLEGEHESLSGDSDGVLADSLNDPADTGRPPEVDDGHPRATIGEYDNGAPLCIDIQKLIETRLLIQAASGGGKSYLIRKLIEETTGQVQHAILDPEGEFNDLAAQLGYELADQAPNPEDAGDIALAMLKSGKSLIVDLYELAQDDRILFVKNFLNALMNSPRDHWHSLLVVVDEAHVFAPDKVKKLPSALAMIDLATRGRKRGFSCILATQRLSKLHKDIAAECLNKLIGRTTLDIDLMRAAGDIGLRKADAPFLRTLSPGEFYAVGPAFGTEVGLAKIGEVRALPVPAPVPAVIAPTDIIIVDHLPEETEERRKARVFNACVEAGKVHIADRHVFRTRIVDLCLKCCDIDWGGGAHWSGHEGVYTARRFAKEIGFNYKTLMSYVRIKRHVIDRLETGEWDEKHYRFAHRAMWELGVKGDPQDLLVEFRRMRDSAKQSYRLAVILQWTRSHISFIRRAKMEDLRLEDLERLKELYADMSTAIEERLKNG